MVKKKVPLSFYLYPDIKDWIEKEAEKNFLTRNHYIERLIQKEQQRIEEAGQVEKVLEENYTSTTIEPKKEYVEMLLRQKKEMKDWIEMLLEENVKMTKTIEELKQSN